jgi:hypothetical protein
MPARTDLKNAFYIDDVGQVRVANQSLFSPRNWLESLPEGAYTVLRCVHENSRSMNHESSTPFTDTEIENNPNPARRLHGDGCDRNR